jgi:hypothetical protein
MEYIQILNIETVNTGIKIIFNYILISYIWQQIWRSLFAHIIPNLHKNIY